MVKQLRPRAMIPQAFGKASRLPIGSVVDAPVEGDDTDGPRWLHVNDNRLERQGFLCVPSGMSGQASRNQEMPSRSKMDAIRTLTADSLARPPRTSVR